MSTIIGGLKIKVDENEVEKYNKIKKTTTAADKTKRAALGDLQNRAVIRQITGKDAAQKSTVETKLQTALRSTRPRVDTHWKRAPLGNSTNASTAQVENASGVGQRKILTRSNSMRTNHAAYRTADALSIPAENKVKTLTTKVVENKPQNVKVVVNKSKPLKGSEKGQTLTVEPTLRREDSNLSRKSLTMLKAAIMRDLPKANSKPTAAISPLKNKSEVVLADATNKVQVKENVKQNAKDNVALSKIKLDQAVSHSAKLLAAVENIDADDSNILILVSEYVNDIYNYLYTLEIEHAICQNHLEGQQEVFAKMRAVLIDWINEVHLQFHLAPETFQMSIAIIDRYLQAVKDTKRSQLQLVGVTALFIAAKYEELYPPALCDFVYITDDTYTAKQILQMELRIFKALDYNLSRPLPIHFLRRYSKAAKAEDSHHTMSKYFLELTSIEYELAAYKPSEIAAASLFLSLHLLNGNAKAATGFNNKHWTTTLEHYSRYSPDHLRPITKKIAAVAKNAPNAKLKSVYTKYQSSKFEKISMRSELYGPLMDSIINSKE